MRVLLEYLYNWRQLSHAIWKNAYSTYTFSCQRTHTNKITSHTHNEVLQSIGLCSSAHWAVNCCFPQSHGNCSHDTLQRLCLPKISPPLVSWISHDPEEANPQLRTPIVLRFTAALCFSGALSLFLPATDVHTRAQSEATWQHHPASFLPFSHPSIHLKMFLT